MIKLVSGDFFDWEADIRVNTVNCVGVMGAGVAQLFKSKFPQMFADYSQACLKNEVRPGTPHVWKEKNMFGELTIINFPTKDHWKNPSEYIYIEQGLLWLRDFLEQNPNKTITLPALGCGHGGLDWEIVKGMINHHLEGINCQILVFEPESSLRIKLDDATDQKLIEKDIHRLLPNDALYPSKLKGRSAAEIFYKGNINLISKKSLAVVANSKPGEREVNALNAIIDELPTSDFVFLLSYNSSYEIDLAKKILSKGFNTILVLPYGICRLKLRKDMAEIVNKDNNLFVSLTDPNQSWKSYESINALKYNIKTADVLLINSIDFSNLEKFEKDIITSNVNRFYLNYWTDPVDFFQRISADKIGINYTTKKPNTDNVIRSIRATKN